MHDRDIQLLVVLNEDDFISMCTHGSVGGELQHIYLFSFIRFSVIFKVRHLDSSFLFGS